MQTDICTYARLDSTRVVNSGCIVDSEMVKKVGHVNEKVSVRNVTMGSVEETWEGGKICELGK